MEKAIQDKKPTIAVRNKPIYKLLASMAREGKHAKAVELAKKIFFIQFRTEPLTSAEASELIKKGMSK